MKPKAIVLDLDGTLLDSKKKISERNLKALQTVRDEGIKIIFATARPPRVASINGIDLFSYGTVVFYNGAMFHCKVTNQNIHFSIPQDVVSNLIEYCLSLDPESNISVEVKDQWFSFKALDYREVMKVKENPILISIDEIKSFECTKILITDFDYSEHLTQKFGRELNILVTDGGQLVQIMSNRSSKESAVRYLVNSFGTEMEDVMCFGDDFNDLSLFKSCGYSIAMGNAIEELKEIASEITKTNDEDGVALILERFVSSSKVQGNIS